MRLSIVRSALVVLALACGPATVGPLSAEPASQGSGYALNASLCGGFPRLPIGMRTGYCAGLVATKADGLVFPRSIVPIPDSRLFVVADMGAHWSPRQGRLLLLDPQALDGKRIKTLIRDLDLPHGLAVGIDKRIYASTADKVFRFDPLAGSPETTVETIVQGLPGLQPRLSGGSRLSENLHPLKAFVFDRSGRIFINIGAPTDRCAVRATESKPCAAGEGDTPLAAIWMFTPPQGGIFPALKPDDANPPREVFARGLRNSIALAAHPKFPDDGTVLLQAENARDLPDLTEPNEELNILEQGKHYGWPYCYDLVTESPEYRAFLRTKTPYQNLCRNSALYRQPHSLMPPHAAPLGMLYYRGEKFPELKDKLLVSLHGYRPTGSRVIVYEVDANGLPKISPAPVHYNVSCVTPATQTLRTQQVRQVPAAAFAELISQWHPVDRVRPQGAPVGMTVDSDGAVWLVEDKNQTVIRIDADPMAAPAVALSCSARTPAQVNQLVSRINGDKTNADRIAQVRTVVIEKHCLGCHADFGLKPGQNDRQKNDAVLRFLLSQDGWIAPGDPTAGRLHGRIWGTGPEKIMPANGRELLADDEGYRQALETLDMLVASLKAGSRRSGNR